MIETAIRGTRLLAAMLALFVAVPPVALAQTPAKPAAPDTSPQKVQLLFVQNGTGMAYDKAKGTLTLKNIARSTLFFTDRPVRMAGHYHTRDEFLKMWSEGPDSFAKNPPNATLSMLEVGQAELQNAVITLRNPRMQGKDLLYDIKLVEGTLPQASGDAVLFIDILGFWRRNIARVAVIGTAAAVTTAAVVSSNAAHANAAQASAAQASAAEASAAAASAAASAAAAKAPQSASTKKLEQLKALQSEGLITAAQYQKASQQVLNELVQ
ncbi:MAG: hypothetical protein ABI569_11265 [Casimicrobiaceae bacterium]